MLCQIPSISVLTARAILTHYSLKTLMTNIDEVDFSNIKLSSLDGKERKISKTAIENIKKYLH